MYIIICRRVAETQRFSYKKAILYCGPGCNKTRCTRSAAGMFTEHPRKLRLTLSASALKIITNSLFIL